MRLRLTTLDWFALVLSLLAVAASGWVSVHIFEAVPHLEDEFAYAWQAAVIASGKLKIPSPPEPYSFLIPFVVDYDGWRFSKYPIGWSALLAVGVRLGWRAWVNPILAGLGVWFTYRLGKQVVSAPVGLLAAFLTLTSPFFLMNSGSLLSHPLGLVLSAAFACGWIEAFATPEVNRRWLPALAAALALGWLAATRPFTALAVAVPFAVHSVALLLHGNRATRQRLIFFGLIAGLVSLIHPLWQYAATGDPWLNTYTLWWSYDKVGFGAGIGASEGGHTLAKAIQSTGVSLGVGAADLFGWAGFSYLLIPFGIWALRRNPKAWLVGSIFPTLVVAYMAYWVGSYLFGPRYYYEGLYSLTILSAAGAAWLGKWLTDDPCNVPPSRRLKLQQYGVLGALTALVVFNLACFLPNRLSTMYRLYSIGRQELVVFQEAVEKTSIRTPALIFVDADRWMHYAIYTELENPELTSPFIFAWSIGPKTDRAAAQHFPEREVYYYDSKNPGKFYRLPAPEP